MNIIDTNSAGSAGALSAGTTLLSRYSPRGQAITVIAPKQPGVLQKLIPDNTPETISTAPRAAVDQVSREKRDSFVRAVPPMNNAVYNVTDVKRDVNGRIQNRTSTLTFTDGRQKKSLIVEFLLAMGMKSLKIFRISDTNEKQQFLKTL